MHCPDHLDILCPRKPTNSNILVLKTCSCIPNENLMHLNCTGMEAEAVKGQNHTSVIHVYWPFNLEMNMCDIHSWYVPAAANESRVDCKRSHWQIVRRVVR